MSGFMEWLRTRVAQKPVATGARYFSPSARELFPVLRDRMLASRPVIGHTVETFHADGSSSGGKPIFGKPTFRNVIDENGDHV